MARAHAANACVKSDSIKGLAQSIAKPAYHRLLIAEPALRRAVPTLIIAFLICRAVVTSKLGKVLIAVRDAESRTRFLGYRVESYKLFVFMLSACMAGVAGALYVPQVGIINPGEFAPGNSIEAVIWVAVGGRGTLIGAALGVAVLVAVLGTATHTAGDFHSAWLITVIGGLATGLSLAALGPHVRRAPAPASAPAVSEVLA